MASFVHGNRRPEARTPSTNQIDELRGSHSLCGTIGHISNLDNHFRQYYLLFYI